MSLHTPFIEHLNDCFTRFFKEDITVTHTQEAKGGDINQTYILHTTKGRYFLKLNAALFGHDFFEKEARGLATLANAGTLKVPRPLFDGKFHQQIYLVMEYLEPGGPATDFWQHFGRSLARLHVQSADTFGLDYDNYIGKLHQHNEKRQTWHEFYANRRIMHLVYRAAKHKMLDAGEVESAESICSKLKDLIPEEKPSLLHGDLWSGNYCIHHDGHAAIFDPAIYYGHREMDLAMTKLLGGFDKSFYEAYEEEFPLSPGAAERLDIFQLYPILVHLLLFGGHYYQSVTDILKKYR